MNLNELFEEHNRQIGEFNITQEKEDDKLLIIPFENYSRRQKRRMLVVKESDLIKRRLK